jgi:hypothetical protein
VVDQVERKPELPIALLVGLILEVLILFLALVNGDSNAEVFKLAARYSGRLSLAVYLFAFHVFTIAFVRGSDPGFEKAHRIVTTFALLHLIHLGFVAMNVRLNAIELVPYKLAGGALAYAVIVVYPLVMQRFRTKLSVHLVYFLYVGSVMAITLLPVSRALSKERSLDRCSSSALASCSLPCCCTRLCSCEGK